MNIGYDEKYSSTLLVICLLLSNTQFLIENMYFLQVFLLKCNYRFITSRSFDEVRDVLSVVLASLYPLKDEQIYQVFIFKPQKCGKRNCHSLQYNLEFKLQRKLRAYLKNLK